MKCIKILTLIFVLLLSLIVLAACDGVGQDSGGDGANSGSGDGESEDNQSTPHVHTLTYVAAKESTCGEYGNIAYYACDCGAYFFDAEGKDRITSSVLLLKKAHTLEYQFDANTHQMVATCGHAAENLPVEEHTMNSQGLCTVCKYQIGTGGLEYVLNGDGTGYLVSGIGTAKGDRIVIPSLHEGKTVVGIAATAFENCTGLKEIVIPYSVTSIGSSAFEGCSGLESITLPFVGASPSATGYRSHFGYIFGYTTSSFSSDFHYREGILGGNHTDYKYCIPESLKSVTITGGSIGEYAFQSCTEVTSITITDYNGGIARSAFRDCKNLVSIAIPSGVTSISYGAFEKCTGLQAVHIADIAAWCKIAFASVDANPLSYAHKLYFNGALITDLVIPDGATSIESRAFIGCTGLTSIEISSSVTSIGFYAFSDCTGLTSVAFTEGSKLESIGSSAFYGCTSLESMTIPFVGASKDGTSNTHFGYIFGASSYGNHKSYVPSSLKTVVITGGTSIGDHAFQSCTGLTSIEISSSVTSIGAGAFCYCTGLTSITIPSNVTSIGNYAFYNCTGLTTIEIPSSVTSIGADAFCYCTGLASIALPSNVTSIDERAFYGCKGLTSIEIPSSVTSIGEYAFSCSGLASITVETGNTKYHSAGNCLIETASGTLVLGCKNSVIPTDGSVTSIGSDAFYYCTSLTSITIPNSVTSIGYDAFRGCTSLTSITIPNSVTSIGNYAFSGCTGLESITLPFVGASKDGTSNTHFGYIFGASSYWNNSSSVPTSLKTVVITGGMSIGSSAFYNCKGLTSIEIPSSVTSIGSYAFYNCTGLTSIEIPSSVTSIGEGAFAYCTGLASITAEIGNTKYHSAGNCLIETASGTLVLGCKNSVIPTDGSVTSIGSYAFYGCTRLTSIEIPSSVTSIGNYAFRNCTGLTSIEIPSSVTSIGSSAFSGCTSLESITLPFVGASKDGTYNTHFGYIFGASSYWDNSSSVPFTLKTVVITGGMSIGSSAFYNCTGLSSIEIPSSVTSIGEYAFSGCTGLTSIEIPSSVTSIGEGAFAYCTGLASITAEIGNTKYHSAGNCLIETASGTLVLGCKNSVIPTDGSVTSIGSYAFYDCTRLTSIEIPSSVTSIGNYAFYNCTGLTTIHFQGSMTQWSDATKGLDWAQNTPSSLEIICTDGTLSK